MKLFTQKQGESFKEEKKIEKNVIMTKFFSVFS